jgi:anti-sigma-K factor RskA
MTEQDTQASPGDSKAPQTRTETPPSGAGEISGRVRVWRAIAGMAIAAALALAIVSIELAHQLAGSSNRLHHRIEKISARMRLAKREAADAERDAKVPAATLKRLRRIMSAPDATFVRLLPLRAGTSGGGFVIASQSVGEAAFEAAGLPALPSGKVYVLWCEASHSVPVKIGELPAADGAFEVAAAPHETRIGRCFLTAESSGPDKPTGPILIRGRSE